MKGKSALVMDCPECGKRAAHNVTKTEPVDGSLNFLFPVAGCSLPSDAMFAFYRVRYRICGKCSKEFSTVEMPEKYFTALKNENDRLAKVEKASKEDKLQIETLTNKLKKIYEIVLEGELVADEIVIEGAKRRKVIHMFRDSP